jgi:hypothetical protein
MKRFEAKNVVGSPPFGLKSIALVSVAAIALFAALLFFVFLVAAWIYFPSFKQALLLALKQLVG